MMEKEVADNEKYYRFLIFTCVGLYMCMMMVKNVYVAEIATIIREFSATKSQASMVNTYYFITYALTQFVLAFLMTKLNVKKYLLVTVSLSATTYFGLVFFIKEISQMTGLFLVNGFAQAGVYACTKSTLGKYLPASYTAKANSLYSLSTGLGFALSYGVCAVCVGYFSWKLPFIIFSVLFLTCLALYAIVEKIVEKNCPVVVGKTVDVCSSDEGLITLKSKRAKSWYVVYWMVISGLTCSISYAINNWVVSYLHETFGFPESLSMAVTITVQLTAMIGPIVAIAMGKRIRNYVSLMRNLYLLPFVIACVMIFVWRVHIVLSVVLLIIFEFFISAAGACVSIMTFDMRRQVNMGSISAFTNTTSSLAAGFIPTVIGSLVDSFGWQAQYVFVAGALMLMLTILTSFNVYIKKTFNKKEICDGTI